MHDESQLVPLEIHSIIANSKPVQSPASALQLPEIVQLRLHNLLGQPTKFTQNLQLQLLWHFGQLSRANRVKDNLEWAHRCKREQPCRGSCVTVVPGLSAYGSAYGNRTRLSALRGPCPNR